MRRRGYRGRRFAVLGAGAAGASMARFLLLRGAEVVVFDERDDARLPADLAGVRLVRGPFDAEALAAFDAVAASPGIPWTHPVLERLRARGVPIRGELDFFARAWSGDVVAITGTNGKTTVATLAARLLDTLPGGAVAAGNIGLPMLDALEDAPPRIVLELSSFQLERARALRVRAAVLTSFAPDHVAAHGGLAAYRAAKERLFRRQRAGDVAILPGEDAWEGLAARLARRGVQVFVIGRDCGADAGGVFWRRAGETVRVPHERLRVHGLHQRGNVAVACQLAACLGVEEEVVREGAESFLGLPHRLQWVAHAAGRDWFDDSKATNPHAARAALASFDAPVIWICGGDLKGADPAGMEEIVREKVAHALVIGRDPAPFLALCARAGVPSERMEGLEAAVARAAELPAHPVLLSPAASSLDEFTSYAERGERFARAARALAREDAHAAA